MNSMKHVFGLFFLLFVILYIGAEATLPRDKNDGIIRMRWATDANPARNVQTALFHKLYPHYKVTVDPGLGNDQTKLIVQCATGAGPDIIDIYDQGQMQTLVEAGVLLDLTPYASKMGFDPSRTYSAIAPVLEISGKQYRFPCNVWANCVIYNKNIFRKLGVPYPKPGWSYSDFIATAEKIRNAQANSRHEIMPIANWNNIGLVEDMLIGNGARFYTRDGLECLLNSPQSLAAVQLYYNMMFRYRVIPTASEQSAMTSQGGWGSEGIDWFSTGKAAMIVIGRWFLIQIPNYPNLRGELGTALLPREGAHPSSGVVDTRAAGINVRSPHWRDALYFLQYLASPEYGKVIVEDGDSLPPNPNIARTGKDLVNYWEEDPAFHAPFIQAVKNGRPLDLSPFIDASEVDRWFTEEIDKIENNIATPQQAMQSLTAQINSKIRTNLERRPDLQRSYQTITGHAYSQDWRRTYR